MALMHLDVRFRVSGGVVVPKALVMCIGCSRLPCTLLHSLALGFLSGQHCLALRFGLAGNFCEAFSLSLPRSFGCFRGQPGSELRRFLALALRFFFQTALLGGLGFLHPQPGFFPRLGP